MPQLTSIDDLLEQMVQIGASDLHITVGSPPAFRVRGHIQRADGYEPFDAVIIDPPRGGMDKRSLMGLINLRAPLFIYVSCNPATLARDLQMICEAGYTLDMVQPVDMFPHTFHVETLVRLRLQGASE